MKSAEGSHLFEYPPTALGSTLPGTSQSAPRSEVGDAAIGQAGITAVSCLHLKRGGSRTLLHSTVSTVEGFGVTCFCVPWDQCFLLPFSIPCSLSSVYSQDLGRAHCSEGENELLSLLKAWEVPADASSLSLVQTAKELKEVLCTSAAFLQGLCGARAHASAASRCSPVPGHRLPAPILVFLPKQTDFWGFLGCSFARGLGLSLWVSTLPFGIQRTSRLFPQLRLSPHSPGVPLPV